MNPGSEGYYQAYCSPEAIEAFARACADEARERAWAAGYWVTKEGRRVRPRQMGDDHVVNTLRLLMRVAEAKRVRRVAAFLLGPTPSGDMAQVAFDDEAAEAGRAGWRDFTPQIFDRLEDEAERRGLAWNQYEGREAEWQLANELPLLRRKLAMCEADGDN